MRLLMKIDDNFSFRRSECVWVSFFSGQFTWADQSDDELMYRNTFCFCCWIVKLNCNGKYHHYMKQEAMQTIALATQFQLLLLDNHNILNGFSTKTKWLHSFIALHLTAHFCTTIDGFILHLGLLHFVLTHKLANK